MARLILSIDFVVPASQGKSLRDALVAHLQPQDARPRRVLLIDACSGWMIVRAELRNDEKALQAFVADWKAAQ